MLDENYKPQVIEFALTDTAREQFPLTLFDGASSFEEVLTTINERFVAIFPERETAFRIMDNNEIQDIREQYCKLQEDEIPIRTQKLEQAIELAKRIKKEAEDELNMVMGQIKELAAKSKSGTKEISLSSTKTIRFALMGYYLYYTWENDTLVLAKTEKIPEWDLGSLWGQDVKNRTAMKEIFGYEFPETQKPSYIKDVDGDF